LNKALRRLEWLAVIGVFAVATVVATAPADATPTEVKTASKHWVEEVDRGGHFD
jgi:hypothetical protein